MTIHLSILRPRLAEGGKIKIGGLGQERTSKGGRKYRAPEKYNRFVITQTLRSGEGQNFVVDQALMDAIMIDPRTWEPEIDRDGKPLLGNDGKPRRRLVRIPILFDSDLRDEVLPTRLAAYWGTRLFCSGTGDPDVPAVRGVFNKESGQKTGTKHFTCPCPLLRAPYNGVQCKPNGTLWATILAGKHTTLGIRHSFRTTSWNSLRSMLASLETIQRRIGTIVNVPCWLVLREERVRDRTDRFRKIFVVHIELQVQDLQELRQLQREALETATLRNQVMALAGRPARLGLPAPAASNEPSSEQKRVAQEYYPPQEDDEDDGQGGDETVDYDLETGEVFDPPAEDAVDPPSPEPTDQRPPQERKIPWDPRPTIDTTATDAEREPTDGVEDVLGDSDPGEPAPISTPAEQPPQAGTVAAADPGTPDDDGPLPEGHDARRALLRLLADVVEDRDFSEQDRADGRKAVWAEACEAIDLPGLKWPAVTKAHADALFLKLASMRRSED